MGDYIMNTHITKGYGPTERRLLSYIEQHGPLYEVETKEEIDGTTLYKQWPMSVPDEDKSNVMYGLVDGRDTIKGYFFRGGLLVIEAYGFGGLLEIRIMPKDLYWEKQRAIYSANT